MRIHDRAEKLAAKWYDLYHDGVAAVDLRSIRVACSKDGKLTALVILDLNEKHGTDAAFDFLYDIATL